MSRSGRLVQKSDALIEKAPPISPFTSILISSSSAGTLTPWLISVILFLSSFNLLITFISNAALSICRERERERTWGRERKIWERIILYTLQVLGMIVLGVERWALILYLRLLSASLWLFNTIIKRVFSMVSLGIILSPLSLLKMRVDCAIRPPWTTPSGNPRITWKSPKWRDPIAAWGQRWRGRGGVFQRFLHRRIFINDRVYFFQATKN